MSDSTITLLEKELRKKYGDDIILSGEQVASDIKHVIPISPAINTIIGGGVPEGSWCSFAGPNSCGKTTMALRVAANAQKKEHGGRDVFYFDVEGRLRKKSLYGISGLNVEKVKVIRSTKETMLSGEDFLTIATNIIKQHEKAVIIIDSVSALCPSAEITEDVSGSIRSTTPKMVASFCRQNAGVVPVMNSIVITIHHLITNTSGYGEHLLMDGGVKIGYQADIRILTKKKPEKWMADGSQIGQIVEWECLKSALGQPYGVTKSYIRYGYGIDDTVEVVNLAVELNIIVKKGAWFYLPFVSEDMKFQGQEKVNEFINQNPQWIDVMVAQILELSK